MSLRIVIVHANNLYNKYKLNNKGKKKENEKEKNKQYLYVK